MIFLVHWIIDNRIYNQCIILLNLQEKKICSMRVSWYSILLWSTSSYYKWCSSRNFKLWLRYLILIYFSETNYLGQVSSLNDQLGDVQKRFTYFVPRDFAWKRLAIDNPSVHKKLFMPEYSNIVSKKYIIYISK